MTFVISSAERLYGPLAPGILPGMKRILTVVAALLLVVLLGAGLWLDIGLRGSLPQLEGQLRLAGLSAPVTVTRDALGTPTIDAASELDMARALGFIHAQERYFEMDLMRRDAAGELSALFGGVTLAHDRDRRSYGIREVARRVVAAQAPEATARMDAYVAGVNAGLAALDAPPFPYLLVRAEPEPWTAEDSWLVALAMFFELHDEDASREARLHLMADVLPASLYRFLTPPGTAWDAPLDGELYPQPPMPSPTELDLRALDPELFPREEVTLLDPVVDIEGSNNWALAGDRTASGRALVANDMHLTLRVPNIWFRVRYRYPQPYLADGEVDMVGVTLPGMPGVVVGSNGRVAWGYTNGYSDVVDLVLLEIDPEDPERYRVGDAYQRMVTREERIEVRGEEAVLHEVRETIWGPVLGSDHNGQPWALAWTALRPGAVDGGLLAMEWAEDLDGALEVFRRAGLPAQNVVLGDGSGRIAWVHSGRVPRRVGFDPQLPASWADDGVGWDGWLEPEEVPVVVDPSAGQVWSANSRVVGGELLARIGDGGFWTGARGAQIRDGLSGLDDATEADMLAIALDDRALFLATWRELLLELLDEEALDGFPHRAEFATAVRDGWDGHASVGSVGFRLVRAFRSTLSARVLEALTVEVQVVDPDFRFRQIPQVEATVWRLVSERPLHLLDPRYADWETLMLDVVDDLHEEFIAAHGSLDAVTWGARNTTRIRHPLSLAVPFLGRWLDAPALQLPGDSNMPRVQSPSFGASERMVVAPGAEERGIFHMPGGQTGHPLSPYHLAGHDDWAEGRATPLLPGETVWTLTLTPGG